jgi:hypothetical protein
MKKNFEILFLILIFILAFTLLIYQIFLKKNQKIENLSQNEVNSIIENSPASNLKWEEITQNTPWTARDSHAVIVFKNKIWLMGGVEGKEVDNQNPVYGKTPHASDI